MNGRRRDGTDTLPLTLTLIPAANNGMRGIRVVGQATNNGMRDEQVPTTAGGGTDTLPHTLTLIPAANNGRD
jgi:hypothetical protein